MAFTFDVEHDSEVDLRLSVDLALVDACVSLLHVLYPEVPLVTGLRVYHAEPTVPRVCEDVGGQDVQVSLPHPGHLHSERYFEQEL